MRIPLFPLNTVLFPGMPLQLHIFEERYKEMINRCIDEELVFGVVMIESGIAQGGPLASPHLVGTTARITQVQRLPFERLNIVAVGQERFRITMLSTDKTYLEGDIDILPMTNDSPQAIIRGGLKLRPLLEQYLGALQEAGQLQFDARQIPTDPTSMAYLAAYILQTDAGAKQDLLESESTNSLLKRLISMYRREVALLDVMLSPPDGEEDDRFPFSLN